MRRFLVVLVLITALASIIALFVVLAREQPRPELEVVQKPPEVIAPAPEEQGAVREQGTIKGKVVFGPTGEPMEGATVIALAPFLDSGEGDELPLWGENIEKKRILTGRDGTFRMEDLPPDYWNLWAEKKGYGWTTIPRAEFKRDHVIKLYPGCRVYGRVLHDDDTPGDGDPGVLFGDYHIQAGSPAVDNAGAVDLTGTYPDLELDFDGEPRPVGGGVDIGADEVQ